MIKIIFQYRANKLRLESYTNLHCTSLEEFQSNEELRNVQKLKKMNFYERVIKRSFMLRSIFFPAFFCLVVEAFIFGLNEQIRYDSCVELSPLNYTLFADLFLCLFILFPVAYYFLWFTEDAFGMGKKLLLSGAYSMLIYPA